MEEVITIPGKGHGNQINYQLFKASFQAQEAAEGTSHDLSTNELLEVINPEQ